MDHLQKIFGSIMYASEFLAALVALMYLPKVKNDYWKYFVIYLILIFLCESFGYFNLIPKKFKASFFNYFVIPLQFIFFYWLYAVKSLKKPKFFYLFSGLYLFSFIPHELFFSEKKIVFSFNYTLGALILLYLVVLEYIKQVNSSDILNFSDNRMFYINWGVTVFYIGTLPLFSFWSVFVGFRDLFGVYYLYFQISGIVMYLLFIFSFILGKQSLEVWGKQNS